MAHKRQMVIMHDNTAALLAGIGCAFAVEPQRNADIEASLFWASDQALKELDFRTLGLIVQWVDVHDRYLNQPRLLRFLKQALPLTLRFWRAIAQWKAQNRKWHSILKLQTHTTRFDLLPIGTDFQIQRKGEDPRFIHTDLRIPKDLLRVRSGAVLSQSELVSFHRIYAHRVQLGVCLRADLWAHLTLEPKITAAQLANKVGCAFASAWAVKQDFELLNQAPPYRKA